tara:strand:- start:1804 stop:2691 length:888 start_codon:yes stop_codon:yes gene_type:complete
MKVIERDTEKQLIADLKMLWTEADTSRCIFLRFSQINFNRKDWLTVLIEEIKAYFEYEVEAVYRCHDNDVFITSHKFTQKNLDIFLTHLKHKLSSAPLQGLAAIFEVRVDWPKLRTICERKIENANILLNKRQEVKTEVFAKINREQALNTINHDLISSLVMRRDARKKSLIMVVEDDPFTQKLIQNTIKDVHELSIAGDGQGAIMTYVNKAPDILFLDIGLPDIDGLCVLEKVFKIDPHAFVVMFSGNGDRDNVLKAIELGAKGFVGKPFTKDKLFQYIEKSPFIQEKSRQGVI